MFGILLLLNAFVNKFSICTKITNIYWTIRVKCLYSKIIYTKIFYEIELAVTLYRISY